MIVYEYRKNKNESIYFPDTWSNEFKENKVTFFIRGTGYKTVSKNKVFEVDNINMPKFNYEKLAEVFEKYGKEVCKQLIWESDCPGAEISYYYIICIAAQAKNPKHLDILREKFDFDVYRHSSKLICLGIYIFPVIEFDKHLHKLGYKEEIHGSINDYLKNVHNLELEF